MSRLPRDPVYLVDASIYIFQAWFSPHYLVRSTAGDDLSAFFGFAQFLQRFLRQTVGLVAVVRALTRGEFFQHGGHGVRRKLLPGDLHGRSQPICSRSMPSGSSLIAWSPAKGKSFVSAS